MTYSVSSKNAKNKRITALLAVLLVLAVVLSCCVLASCKKDKENIVIDVYSVEDLLKISDYLDYDTEKIASVTVNLQADLDMSDLDWAPLGDSYTNAFKGTFNGNNHKIFNLAFNGEKDESEVVADGSGVVVSEYNPTNHAYVGLFGYIADAQINDLSLGYSAKLRMGKEGDKVENIDFSTLYIGGVAGFAYGDCSYTNVNVDGNVDLVSSISFSTNKLGKRIVENKYSTYVGGMVGYAVGTTNAIGITSNMNVSLHNNLLNTYEHEELALSNNFNSRFKTAQIGGVFGYVRTSDISMGENNENNIFDVKSKINADINAETVFCGGLSGSIYNATITDYMLESGSNLIANIATRGELGGAFGLIDNCVFKNALIDGAYLECAMVTNAKSADYLTCSIGGAVGYVTNDSCLESIAADVQIASRQGCVDYAGGLVGVLDSSRISDAASKGNYKEEKSNGMLVSIELSNKYSSSDYKFGGIVGRAHAKAEISNVDVSFVSPKAIVGVVTQKIIYKKVQKDGEDVFEKDEANSLPASSENEFGEEELGNYVDYASVTYYCAVENDLLYANRMGSKVADSSACDTRFETIKTLVTAFKYGSDIQ